MSKEVVKTSNLIPESMNEKMIMADIFSKANGKMLPANFKTKEDIFLALQLGAEIGLSPMQALNNIYIVNGKTSMPTNLKTALVKGKTDYLGTDIVYNDKRSSCTVTVTRMLPSGIKETSEGYFDMEMAKKAELLNKENWKKYPDRMLKHRATARALDDSYSDLFAGIYDPEELEKIEIQDGAGNITGETTTGAVSDLYDNIEVE